VGGEAARHLWLALKYGFIFPWITPVWFVLLFFGFSNQDSVLWVLGFVLVAVQVPFLVLAVQHLRLFHRAASQALGVHVGWNDPPMDEAKYIAWCRAKGIEPFFGRGSG